ncbi:Lorelei-like-GPI-anchored protein [Arachis hypogaea]|uniref:Lorelei-like-GPI-anchored protein n=1 Tax=Arachis hypogaea TaxID=3818 RepID=A0A6B9V688_ARAHY|nr:Lorelei-like-GPI-anchored protein [Arachis hypogaea]
MSQQIDEVVSGSALSPSSEFELPKGRAIQVEDNMIERNSCLSPFLLLLFLEHTARHLLQAKRGCSVNFEFANYTIITSKCKGPNYPPKECCGAFKEFACPYADVLNDLQNDIYLRIQERTGLILDVDEHELQDKVDKHSNDVSQVPGGEMKSEQGANDFGQLGDRTDE